MFQEKLDRKQNPNILKQVAKVRFKYKNIYEFSSY